MSTQKNGGKTEVENWEFSIKQDSEAGQSVIVCAQGECTTVTAQHFPDKHQANPLPVRLGGEEGTEEFSFGLFADSGTIVYDFYKSGGSGPYRYFALLACRFSGALYTFGSILNDIYQNLLEQRSIQTHLPYFGVAFQTENNVTVIAHSLHKTLAHGYQFVQLNLRYCRFGYLHHIGKAGNETAHRETALRTHAASPRKCLPYFLP